MSIEARLERLEAESAIRVGGPSQIRGTWFEGDGIDPRCPTDWYRLILGSGGDSGGEAGLDSFPGQGSPRSGSHGTYLPAYGQR